MLKRYQRWRAERQKQTRLRKANAALKDDGPYFAQEIRSYVARGYNLNLEQFTWLKMVRRCCLAFARQAHALDFYETVENAQLGVRHLRYVLLFLKRMGLEGSVLNQEEAEVYADGVDACDEELWTGNPREWSGSEIRDDLKEIFERAKKSRKQRIETSIHA